MKHYCSLFLVWTRSIVLLLSILIVILSLYVYNKDTQPIFSLLNQQQENLVNDMIENKRLIATLVAAQASIFCPLFLLLNPQDHPENKHHLILLESFMPSGLALSWIFCISFEDRINALHTASKSILALYLEYHLKYVIVVVLLLEVLVILASSIYACQAKQPIQLPLDVGQEEQGKN
ncbi:uncharacterized protein B0P05DRAFT_542616 [Gilbertella persicaria]|uniref:Uncharacterized protein n=1 Tax=Rhizopus stolonifer TaxID=4846 RepID=A0A367JIM3_RHIST|nr:uncharacterized protein B0P05DRAFT_542616 [Gilbertella persicaria]KAI8078127.1 hypothetical protein B0P05DRAFT_542616 [Gilbertella persicaria]RCH89794.1 hypothetical protein CU098_009893 [Rhizopus stolonifer]